MNRTIFFWSSVCFLVLLVHASTLFSEPFWDDYSFIFHSPLVTALRNPFLYWDKSSFASKSWPLGYLFFWGMFKLFGSKYFYWGLASLLIHIANGSLLLKILRRLKFRSPFLVAAIFLIHPIHVETVSWAIQLNTLLGTFFGLLCVLCLIKYFISRGKNKRVLLYILSLTLFLLSLWSKPVAVCLPLVFAFFFFERGRINFHLMLWRLLPFFTISVLITLSTISAIDGSRIEREHAKKYVQSEKENFQVKDSLSLSMSANKRRKEVFDDGSGLEILRGPLIFSKIFAMSRSFYFYVAKIFFPVNQMFFYPKSMVEGTQVFVTIFSFLIFLAFLAWGKISKTVIDREVRLGLVFFTICYIPISGLFYVPYMKYSLYADHWIYFSSIGLCVALVGLINCLLMSEQKKIFVTLFIGVIFSVSTLRYSTLFNDREVMLLRNYQKNKENLFLVKYISWFYLSKESKTEALEYLLKAKKLDPGDGWVLKKLDRLNSGKTRFSP